MNAACRKICSGSNLSFGPSLPARKKIRMHYSFDFAQQVLENSSPVSHLNVPHLFGTAEGKVSVQTFDWQQHLTRHFRRLPQIKSYQHFSFCHSFVTDKSISFCHSRCQETRCGPCKNSP